MTSPAEKDHHLMADVVDGYRQGEAGYRRITVALFAAGLATFASMYCIQAVLPDLARSFSSSPAGAALTVSATTGALALSIIPASILSERYGRTRVMSIAALVAAVIGLLIPFAGSLHLVVALRAVQGVTLAGVPAVGMAYLAEEVHPSSLGTAMGRYIAGNTIGGLAGRLIASTSLEFTTWRVALEFSFAFALALTCLFIRSAPASRHFTPKPIGARQSWHNVAFHLRSRVIMALVAMAFLLMGAFVSVYNVLGFRLIAPPFSLSPAIAGLVFLLYLSGTASAARAGRLADRIGRVPTLIGGIAVMFAGLVLTLPDWLPTVVAGVLLFTAGFFAAHSCASSAVGVYATKNRAEASSLYLFGYYAGSCVLGAVAGIPYAHAGWFDTVIYVGLLVLTAGALVTFLARRSARSVSSTPRSITVTKSGPDEPVTGSVAGTMIDSRAESTGLSRRQSERSSTEAG